MAEVDLRKPPEEGETPDAAIVRLAPLFGLAPRCCIVGGTAFQEWQSEQLVVFLSDSLCNKVGDKAIFITGGRHGIQETFARHCPAGVQLYNLIDVTKEASGFPCGTDVWAGRTPEECSQVFSLIGDVYITVEGGQGVAAGARSALARGADVIPLMRTGGASSGMFGFPAQLLKAPNFATKEQWAHLKDRSTSLEQSAATCAELVSGLLREWQAEPLVRGRRMTRISGMEALEPTTPAAVDTFRPGRMNTRLGQEEPGAPSPQGARQMTMNGSRDLRAAFDMLDTKNEKQLDRLQARSWLRCAGWLLPDEELDEMLNGRKPVHNAREMPHYAGYFTRQKLMEISASNRNLGRGNCSEHQFSRDLRVLSKSRDTISRKYLLSLINADPDTQLTEHDLDEVLALLGMDGLEHLDCSVLGKSLLAGVAAPPSVVDVLRVRKELSDG